MNTFQVHVSTLARLFEGVGHLDPDGWPDKPGPGGPHIFGFLRALLNPQPLPPRSLHAFSANAYDPTPVPWRGAAVATVVADRLVMMVQTAETFGVDRQAVGKQIAEFVDDWCGTPPRRWPFPWPPWRFGLRDPRDFSVQPAELVQIGIAIYRAAEALGGNEFAGDLVNAANQFAQTGLERLDQTRALTQSA
jgi:hypothetical protein